MFNEVDISAEVKKRKDCSAEFSEKWETEKQILPNAYQKAAMRTANDDFRNWTYAHFGLTGETGEVSDIMKKHIFHGHPLDTEKLKKECGDVLWYIALICEMGGFTLDDVMKTNIQKLWERYPNGFEKERSINRKEGDD